MSDVKIIGPTEHRPIWDSTIRPPFWERRERIATIILAGLVTKQQLYYDDAVAHAVTYADTLIAKLDKPKEEDKA